MAITMKDVANHAGVGLGTVSNYITGKCPVSKAKADRVQKSIEALGYRVNETARSLKSKSFNTIGVLVPSFNNVYLVRIVSHIEKVLREMGYTMLVVSSDEYSQSEKHLLMSLAQKVDGIVYMPTVTGEVDCEFFDYITAETPIVTFNENLTQVNCDKVLVNHRDIIRRAVELLVSKGHKKIGILIGAKGLYTTRERFAGYLQGLQEAGIPYDMNLVKYSDYTRQSGEDCMKELVDIDGVHAVIMSANQLTIGGLSVVIGGDLENDIDIIGFDVEEIEKILKQKICYMYKSHKEIAETVVSLMLSRVEGDRGNSKTVQLEAELKNSDAIGC